MTTKHPATERAVQTLTHYIEKLFQECGLIWDGDNASEIRGIVEDIVEAARAPERDE